MELMDGSDRPPAEGWSNASVLRCTLKRSMGKTQAVPVAL